MRLIIAGGRDFDNYNLLCDEVTKFISENTDANDSVKIISGLARGADTLGCKYAQEAGYELQGFAAEWGKFGKAAGPIRNKLMAKHADSLIAFWDGESPGTMHMIDYANELGLNIKVVKYGNIR
jgi:predicted Rossmann fold nucleotide-binding protein DprA/Smf involved in DNA uptake